MNTRKIEYDHVKVETSAGMQTTRLTIMLEPALYNFIKARAIFDPPIKLSDDIIKTSAGLQEDVLKTSEVILTSYQITEPSKILTEVMNMIEFSDGQGTIKYFSARAPHIEDLGSMNKVAEWSIQSVIDSLKFQLPITVNTKSIFSQKSVMTVWMDKLSKSGDEVVVASFNPPILIKKQPMEFGDGIIMPDTLSKTILLYIQRTWSMAEIADRIFFNLIQSTRGEITGGSADFINGNWVAEEETRGS